MEKLRAWIKKREKIKDFLENTGISRSFFYEWLRGEKGLSLKMASKIVKYTKNEISFEDLALFEEDFESFQKEDKPR